MYFAAADLVGYSLVNFKIKMIMQIITSSKHNVNILPANLPLLKNFENSVAMVQGFIFFKFQVNKTQ